MKNDNNEEMVVLAKKNKKHKKFIHVFNTLEVVSVIRFRKINPNS